MDLRGLQFVVLWSISGCFGSMLILLPKIGFTFSDNDLRLVYLAVLFTLAVLLPPVLQWLLLRREWNRLTLALWMFLGFIFPIILCVIVVIVGLPEFFGMVSSGDGAPIGTLDPTILSQQNTSLLAWWYVPAFTMVLYIGYVIAMGTISRWTQLYVMTALLAAISTFNLAIAYEMLFYSAYTELIMHFWINLLTGTALFLSLN